MPEWFQDLAADALPPFLTAFLTVAALAFLRSKLKGPNEIEPTIEGRIRVSRITMWSCALIGAVLCAAFIALMYFERTDPALIIFGPIGIVMFALLTIVSLAALSPTLDVAWDQAGVEGPAKQFSFGWRTKRAKILWINLAEREVKKNGVVRLSSSDGENIFYSHFYANYGALEAAIKSRRPDVF